MSALRSPPTSEWVICCAGLGLQVVGPDVIGSGRAVVVVEQLRAVARVRRSDCRRTSSRPRSAAALRRACVREVVEINVGVAVDVGGPGQRAAIGRERSGVDLPLVVGEPLDLLGCDVEQSDIVVAVVRVRGDEDGLAVGRDVGGEVGLLALMRREVGGSCRVARSSRKMLASLSPASACV